MELYSQFSRSFKTRVFSLLIFLFLFLGLNSVYSQIRIMPLGDSITHGVHGSDPVGGFRDDLASFLLSENIDFDMVGTLNDGVSLYPWHEGHPGETANYIANHISSWLNQTHPDIVLLHIGTNDINNGYTNTRTRDNIERILTEIWKYNAATPILLCSLIPRNDSLNSTNTDLCQLIHQLTVDKLHLEKPIRYVGQNEVWVSNRRWAKDYLSDLFHPNNTGYGVMAEVYFNILMNQITGTNQLITDNFNRSNLGYTWKIDSHYRITNEQLTINTGGNFWWEPAVYIAEQDPIAVTFTWGSDVDSLQNGNAGLALLLNKNSTITDGYLVYKESETGKLRLFLITGGAIDRLIHEIGGKQATPHLGDEFKVAMYQDEYGHHFNCFINDQYDGELTDPDKLQGNSSDLFAGIMLAGTVNNVVDNFKLVHFKDQAEKMYAVWGDEQQGKINTTLNDSLVVQVTDGNGNPIGDVSVNFEVTKGDATIESGQSGHRVVKVTNSSGKAYVRVKLGSTPGMAEIQATSTVVSNMIIFHAYIISDDPAFITKTNGDDQTAEIGKPLLPFEVTVKDKNQNPVQNATILFEVIEGEGRLIEAQPVYSTEAGKATATLVLGQKEGINRVRASCPGFTIDPVIFKATAIRGGFIISGDFKYFSNEAPIAEVVVDVSGDQVQIDTTSIEGLYKVNNITSGSNLKIAPQKENYDNSDFLISTYDAAITMQHVIKLDTLQSQYFTAADVDKNGQVQAYDAALIAYYTVGLPRSADSHVGEWLFTPPYRNYWNITTDYRDQNFTGLIRGDVTGRWDQSNGLDKKLAKTLYPRFNNFMVQPGDTFTIPLAIEANQNMISCLVIFKYDKELLTCTKIAKTELTQNFELVSIDQNEYLKAGLYSAYEVNDAGAILEFTFLAKGTFDQETVLSLERFQINDQVVQYGTSVVLIQTPDVPMEFTLHQNYPNPFNPTTAIPYRLPQAGNVQINLYNLLGQKIAALYDGFQQSGSHQFKWNGTDHQGNDIASGVFLCEVKFENQRQTIKLIKLQ